MIGQITPLVKAAGRRHWARAALSFAAGATASGALLGLVLGATGVAARTPSLRAMLPALGGAVFLLAALHSAGTITVPLPSFHRQTPKWFKDEFGATWGSLAWGLDLGQGWTTRVEFAGYYGLVAWTFMWGGSYYGAMTMAAFGLGRSLPVLAAGSLTRWQEPGALASALMWRTELIHRVNAVALACVAACLIAAW